MERGQHNERRDTQEQKQIEAAIGSCAAAAETKIADAFAEKPTNNEHRKDHVAHDAPKSPVDEMIHLCVGRALERISQLVRERGEPDELHQTREPARFVERPRKADEEQTQDCRQKNDDDATLPAGLDL